MANAPPAATPKQAVRALLSRVEASRLEQHTLQLSLYGTLLLAFGSIAWGLYIESNVVVLDGIFSLFSLIGSGLSLLAARLILKPEDRRFHYGYSHLEPLVHSVNGLMLLVMCGYAFINGLVGIRDGGNPVDAQGVIQFSIVSAIFCFSLGWYEMRVGRRVNSQLLRNNAKSWLMDALFSMVILLGFAVLPFLTEPLRATWARYADPAMVSLLSLLLLPVPIGILKSSLREVLIMSIADDKLVGRVDGILAILQSEHDTVRAVHHTARSGRTVFIEIELVVGPDFTLQTVAQQDTLRDRTWHAMDLPLDQAWLSIPLTTDPRWV